MLSALVMLAVTVVGLVPLAMVSFTDSVALAAVTAVPVAAVTVATDCPWLPDWMFPNRALAVWSPASTWKAELDDVNCRCDAPLESV